MSQNYYVFLAEIPVVTGSADFDYTDPTARTRDLLTDTSDPNSGTYFLRGDDTDSDLAKLFKTAVNSGAGLVIDTAAVTFDVDAASAPFTFTLTGDGSWTLLSTGTFDLTTIGFASGDFPIASTANAIATTLGSKYVWVAPEPPSADDPGFNGAVAQTRTVGGQVRTTELGGPYNDRSLSFEMIDPERTLQVSNAADTDATFETFWSYVRAGKRFEVHKTTISSGSTLGALSSSTLVGTYVLSQQSAAAWRPRRYSPGVELYSWPLELMEYVA